MIAHLTAGVLLSLSMLLMLWCLIGIALSSKGRQ